MKKILVVLLALSMIFALSACASKEYKDTVVTIPVTDENGEGVTDEAGNAVTEVVTEDLSESEESSSLIENSNKETTKNNSKTTTQKNSKATTSKKSDSKKKTSSSASSTNPGASSNGKETTKEKETEKATTTETTTEKPKKRQVTVQVVIPFYNNQETNLSVRYKTPDDKKYTQLEFENPENDKEKLTYETILLDGKTVKTYDLGEIKGDVTVIISMTGVDTADDTIVIPASESTGTIKPVTGIEMMEGDLD